MAAGSHKGEMAGEEAADTTRLGRRALFVLPADTVGGAERLTFGLIEVAARKRLYCDVDVLVLAKEPSGSMEYLRLDPNISIAHVRAHREYGALVKFINYVRRREFDLVFSTHTHVNALCCLLRRVTILKTNRLVTRESSSMFEVDCGKYNMIIPYLIRMYGSQDLLIHQTEYMRSSFNRHTGGRLSVKCRVAPNPVDVARIELNASAALPKTIELPEQAIKVVWCGRLINIKQPLLAIETMRRLHEQQAARWHLVVVGDGPLMGPVRAAATQWGLSDQITFCGHLDNPWSVMSRCDVGLLTSVIEGFPNVVLEMLACGVRGVVTTNCAGDLDTVPGVHVAETSSAEALAARLVETVTRPRPDNVEQFLSRRTPEAFLRALAAHE